MHGEIDAPVQERLLDLFREEPLAADLGERTVDEAIARGGDDGGAKRAVLGQHGMSRHEPVADVAGLGDGERAAPRTDDYWQAHVHSTELGVARPFYTAGLGDASAFPPSDGAPAVAVAVHARYVHGP